MLPGAPAAWQSLCGVSSCHSLTRGLMTSMDSLRGGAQLFLPVTGLNRGPPKPTREAPAPLSVTFFGNGFLQEWLVETRPCWTAGS